LLTFSYWGLLKICWWHSILVTKNNMLYMKTCLNLW
jgi:hypothetical protein